MVLSNNSTPQNQFTFVFLLCSMHHLISTKPKLPKTAANVACTHQEKELQQITTEHFTHFIADHFRQAIQ
jgi:hypothetical protein